MKKTRKRSDPDRPSWALQLEVLKAEVETMPLGPPRDAAARRADQLEAAIHMDHWLRSPEPLASNENVTTFKIRDFPLAR